jgi:uncharacterized membrane protein
LAQVDEQVYRRNLGHLLADKPHLGYAVVFYVLYIAGIVFFALRPALDGGSWLTALGYGAALGTFAYATYDLTNAATLKSGLSASWWWTSSGAPR